MNKPKQIKPTNNEFNLDLFLRMARKYLAGHGEAPSIETQSVADLTPGNRSLRVHFSDNILKRITLYERKFRRDITAIARYGFRGGSNGGVNGVVLISQDPGSADQNFGDLVSKATSERYAFAYRRAELDPNANLTPVKVVCHRKSGERIVGVLDRKQGRALIFEHGSYTK